MLYMFSDHYRIRYQQQKDAYIRRNLNTYIRKV